MSIGILPNVNSFLKQNRDAKQGTSVCSRTTRLKNKRVRSQKKSFNSQNGKSDDKAAVAIVKTVPQLGCVSQDSEPSRLQERREVQGRQKVLRSVKQLSGKRKDRRLEKYKSNIFISEVPTLRNLRTDLKKRLKDRSDVPTAGHGTLPKTYTSSKKRTKLHSSRPQKNGHSRLPEQGVESCHLIRPSGQTSRCMCGVAHVLRF